MVRRRVLTNHFLFEVRLQQMPKRCQGQGLVVRQWFQLERQSDRFLLLKPFRVLEVGGGEGNCR